jgi:hypothetical protein
MRLPGIKYAVSCIANEGEFAGVRRRPTSSSAMRVADIKYAGKLHRHER